MWRCATLAVYYHHMQTNSLEGKIILWIEDDTSLRDLVATRVLQEQCIILHAEYGADGLRSADAQRPDLIMLDIQMPGMVCLRRRPPTALALRRGRFAVLQAA